MPTKSFAQSVSDKAVAKATGKVWQEWFTILDAAGAKKMKHAEIARWLSTKKKVSGWWSQMLSVGYEQARGLRQPGQIGEGFEISVSRTLDLPPLKAFQAWLNEATRKRWLQKNVIIRKANPPQPHLPVKGKGSATGGNIRFTWPDSGVIVEVRFSQKGRAKTQIALQHGKLPNARSAEKMKQWWKEALGRFEKLMIK